MNQTMLSLPLLLLAFGGAQVAASFEADPSAPPAQPQSDAPLRAPSKSPVLCPIPKADAGGAFYVVTSPDITCPKAIMANEPIYAILECVTGPGSATCEAWPRVYPVNPGDEDRLQYAWTVRVGWVTHHYPQGSNPTISFGCPGIQPVSVTVQVSNGTAIDYDLTGFRCGDDPR